MKKQLILLKKLVEYVSVPNDYLILLCINKKKCYKINKLNINFTFNYNTKILIGLKSFAFTQHFIIKN